VFHLGRWEKEVLSQILGLYPRVPSNHHQISRSGTGTAESEQLVADALSSQQSENKAIVGGLLSDHKRFIESGTGFELSLSTAEAERMLEVLNDIRVGSWAALGAPETIDAPEKPEMAHHFTAMEIAGLFQMGLLEALGR
jgi:hypothetical protein